MRYHGLSSISTASNQLDDLGCDFSIHNCLLEPIRDAFDDTRCFDIQVSTSLLLVK